MVGGKSSCSVRIFCPITNIIVALLVRICVIGQLSCLSEYSLFYRALLQKRPGIVCDMSCCSVLLCVDATG